ncbi:MAG TPA: hypothetical protein H9948_00215 [Candidatus Jeotgalibaca merdavium]|uniref:Head-tail adaptor protein n=1 Tax=Candidatus Jeotgalibaca merdavium TaxID=2838627 RepID=A0A9D2HZT3_9LACT|nr:hypothetical protein [Candidatus Jeotgalibaca merdavium]
MRLFPLFLYANQEVGSDPLGNPINELVVIGEFEGRFSSWTSEEIALDNRQITMNNRKIVTTALKSDLQLANKIKFDGFYHSITEIRGDDYDRWRLVVVNRYGSDTL